MNTFTLLLNRAGDAAAAFAGPAFLQSTVLIAVVAGLDRLLRRRAPAALRSALWLLVLVKLALPPSLALPTGVGYWLKRPAPPAPAPAAVGAPAVFLESAGASLPPPALGTPPPRPAPRLRAEAWLLLGWAAGALVLAGVTLVQWLRVRRLARGARPAAPELAARLECAARRLGLRRVVRLRLADSPHGPLVFGLFRPVILLPERLAAGLATDQLDDVLLHELAHVRRGDLWTGHAQALLQCLWWWHPLVWLAGRRLDRAREEAADEAVLAALDREPPRYAETLVAVARLVTARPGLTLGFLGILERRSALRRRVERLLDGPAPRRRLGWGAALLLAAFAAAALPMAPGPAENIEAAPRVQPGEDSEHQAAVIRQLQQRLWDQRTRVILSRGRIWTNAIHDEHGMDPYGFTWAHLPEELRRRPAPPLGSQELVAMLETGLKKMVQFTESRSAMLASMPEGTPAHSVAQRELENDQFMVELVRLRLAEARLHAALAKDAVAFKHRPDVSAVAGPLPADTNPAARIQEELRRLERAAELTKESLAALEIAGHGEDSRAYREVKQLAENEALMIEVLRRRLARESPDASTPMPARTPPPQAAFADPSLPPPPHATDALLTRFFRLAPHRFLEAMRRSGVPEAAQASTSTEAVRAYFKAAGIEALPPKGLLFNEDLGVLMVRLPMDEMEVVQTAIEMLNSAPPMVQLETQFVTAAGGAGFNELPGDRDFVALSQARAGELRQRLQRTAGLELLAAPKVTTLSGRAAEIAVGEPAGAWASVLAQVEANGFSITLEVSAKLRDRQTAQIITLVEDGQTLLARLRPAPGVAPDDAGALILVTPTLVDPAGNPIHPGPR